MCLLFLNHGPLTRMMLILISLNQNSWEQWLYNMTSVHNFSQLDSSTSKWRKKNVSYFTSEQPPWDDSDWNCLWISQRSCYVNNLWPQIAGAVKHELRYICSVTSPTQDTSHKWRGCHPGIITGILGVEVSSSKLYSWVISWVVPLPSNSHHQDYCIFSRGSQPNLESWEVGHSWVIFLFPLNSPIQIFRPTLLGVGFSLSWWQDERLGIFQPPRRWVEKSRQQKIRTET